MFNSARLKLTGWYLLIIIFVSLSFSSIIYLSQTAEIDRLSRLQRLRIERRLVEGGYAIEIRPKIPAAQDLELIEDSKKHLVTTLLVIDSAILIISALLGYFLAGRTLKPIKVMVDEQNRFIGDASHELRTPLTALKSAMEVYLRDRNSTQKDAKSLIIESIDQVNKLQILSNSLLNLSVTPNNSASHQPQKIAVNNLLNKSIREVNPMAKLKKIEIKYSPIEAVLEGDNASLINLFVILLDNAIKYSQEKSDINVSSKIAGNSIAILVVDKGVGIDSEDLPHIFDRFYRADRARERKQTGGYGLGLSIAKEIVKTHNGTIECESNLGPGTTFIVKLPLKQAGKIIPSRIFS